MEYWTIIDNRHAGPYTARQLVEMGVLPDTPIWYEGLPDWVSARDVPEIVAAVNEHMAREPQPNQEPQPCQEQPAAYRPQPAPYRHEPAAYQPQGAPQQPESEPAQGECPPSYLVWSIIATLLCCQPFGIAAIICSAQVRQMWRRGNAARALKMSAWAQWCIILSIVLGLVFLPTYFIFLELVGQ